MKLRQGAYAQYDEQHTAELDAWLQRPRVRLTRAFRRGEWSTAQDLFGALELAHSQWGPFELELERLVKEGIVEVEHGEQDRYLLIRELAPPGPTPPQQPGREGEELGGFFFWRGSWRRA